MTRFFAPCFTGLKIARKTLGNDAFFSTKSSSGRNDIFIIGAARTPQGSFRGELSSISGPKLGALAIEKAISRSGFPKKSIDSVYMGVVLPASMGQAPDRQAALYAGLPDSVPCTMINKVCASGMKTVMLAAGSIALGENQCVVAGGFESMSNVPFYLPRGETTYGGLKLFDGLVLDGLTDVYNQFHMGNCGEKIAKQMKISREAQDMYALASYSKAAEAYSNGDIGDELFSVEVPRRKGSNIILVEDEEYKKINKDKFKKLPAVFQTEGNGTVTAGNASTLSDGAAACVLANEAAIKSHDCKPLARLVGWADGAVAPVDFPIAPKVAIDRLLKSTGVRSQDVALWEINEAFSVVALANISINDLDPAKVNVHGGAVSLGHPLGASGCRIINHLVFALKSGQLGVASICNGGGGASAIMMEKL